MDNDLDGKLDRLRARVQLERRRVEELNRQAAGHRAAAVAIRAQAAAIVEAAIARQQHLR